MSATQPAKDEVAGGRDAGPLEQGRPCIDIAGIGCSVKRFATLQAHLALAGFTLTRSDAGFYVVARWNVRRHLNTLEQVEQFQRSVST